MPLCQKNMGEDLLRNSGLPWLRPPVLYDRLTGVVWLPGKILALKVGR